jgi:hypothetical protein
MDEAGKMGIHNTRRLEMVAVRASLFAPSPLILILIDDRY